MPDGFDRQRRPRRPGNDPSSGDQSQRRSRTYSNRNARSARDARYDDSVSYRSSYSSSSESRSRDQARRSTSEQRQSRPRQASDAYRDRDRYRTANRRTTSAEPDRRSTASRRGQRASQNSYVAYDGRAQQKREIPKPLMLAIVAAVVLVIGIGGFAYAQSLPITISVNGVEQELGAGKNIESILSEKLADPRPGNFVAVDGETLSAGEGERLYATVNGQETSDYSGKLNAGDQVIIEDGHNIVEPSQDTTTEVDFVVREEGVGAITILQSEGEKGITTKKVGNVSGKTVEEETRPKQDRVFYKYNPDVGTDKVVALTFDDGPWGEQTQQILNILSENDAKATFFVVGNRINGDGVDLVKKMHENGHQVATHTFSHASGDGGGHNMGLMKPEDQIAEVTKGYESIKNATGEEPPHIFRSPGGNYSLDTMNILASHVTAEIRWNIDTEDWRKPGPDVITDHIIGADPGSIILAHDGGGKRDETIEGLKKALPRLKEKGYRFITIEELMQYPAE